MFYYTDIPDGGDIIAQETFQIEYNDYISDVLDKVDKATYNMMRAYFQYIYKGIAPRREQNHNLATYRRLRTNVDSLIDWNQNSIYIYNKIRAISHPYPGAIGIIDNKKYKIWRAKPLNDFKFGQKCKPGKLVARLYDSSLIIKSKDGFIKINEYELYK